MKLTNPPIALPIPFASAASPGTLNVIPIPSQVGITAGAASYETGFPTSTFLDPADGGVAPLGADFNGVLNAIGQSLAWIQAGGSFQYNATFSADIFGYPQGAILQRADATGGWINTIDQNTSNPDTGGAGWLPYGGSTSPLQLPVSGSNITLTALQAASNSITLSGTLTASISIILPTWAGGRWLVINKATMGIFSITFTTASGSGVVVNSGESSLYGDGTDIILTGNPGIPDAPADGNIYGRKNNAWVVAVAGSPLINPMTAANDIIIGGAAGAATRLAIGAANTVLAFVGGAITWASASLLGAVNVFTKNQSVAPVALTYASTVTPDASQSNNFSLKLAGACTLANPTNLTAGMVLNFTLDQDATGGRVTTFDSLFKWPAGTAPTFTTTANAKNFISAYYDGTILRCNYGAGYA